MLDLNLGLRQYRRAHRQQLYHGYVRLVRADRQKQSSHLSHLTLLLGGVFLGVKVVEYKQKFDHHLIPGRSFDITYCSNNPAACGLKGKELEDEKKEVREAIDAEKEYAEKLRISDPVSRPDRCERSRAALFLSLFRYDRSARAPHDHRAGLCSG